jgi:Papain family cysteine protease
MEGLYQLKYKPSVFPNFSEQQVIDCSGSYGNSGCNGGLMTNVFNYFKSNKIENETDYPFTGGSGTCTYNSAKGTGLNINAYTAIPANAALTLQTAVITQPISVAIEADASVF